MRATLPFIAFFLSGASSLIFQMIWSRLLHHVFGSSSVAISSVVSVFMGGLALGAWLFGRYADRIRRPLLLYAAAEVGVGLFAMLVPLLVHPDGWLATVNASLRNDFGAESTAFMVARFLCIVPILIVPTTLMGSTLPLLARHFVGSGQSASGASARVGALYAVNTVGAVAGVFLAGFILMPRIGVATTNAVAVSMNFALAAGLFLLRRQLPAADEAAGANADAVPEPEASEAFPTSVRVVAALAFALSGFCALLYEVVWSRALVNTIGASVYAFALILMTFLTGIAGGSAIASYVVGRRGSPVPGLAVAAFALSAAAVIPLAVRVGLAAWLGTCLLLGLILLAIVRLSERATRSLASLEGSGVAADSRRPSLLVIAVPTLSGLALAATYHERLEWIALSVILCGAGLLLLLLLLRGRVLLLLAGIQLFIAISTFVSDIWADEISLAFAAMVVPLYEALGDHVDRVMALMFTTAAMCVLPSALGMGAMFPITMRVWSSGGGRIGRDVGVVYTGNTVGSIVGAWLPGFVLMPMLGMQATLHTGLVVNLLLALGIVLVSARVATADKVERRGRLLLAPLIPALIALLYVGTTAPASPITWNLTRMTLGVFRISLAKDVLDEEAWGEPDLVYYKDGLSTTVSVERWGRHYSLKNNGKVEASNGDDMPTQIMVSALPLMFHERGSRDLDVAIIGLGSGVTVGAALQFPVRSVDVVELERSISDASRFFADVNHLDYQLDHYPYIDTPRLKLINDDGRNYLASSDKTYDVIVSEPSNPWITGVSDLFTTDHFRVSKRKLRRGGVYCQWVQLYEMSPDNVKIIYRTFASQFEHVVVFSAEDLSSDTILLGSDSPLPLDLARIERALAEPAVATELERAYVHSPYDVLARVLLSNREEAMRYTQRETRLENGRWELKADATGADPCPPESCRREPSPLNTDDNALIEFAAPRDLIGFERYRGYLRSIYAPSWPYGRLRESLTGVGERGAEAYAEQAMALLAHGRKREARRMIERAAQLGASPSLERARAMFEVLGGAAEPELRVPPPRPDERMAERSNQRLRDAHAEVMDWLGRGDHDRAADVMAALPSSLVKRASPQMRLLRAYLMHKVEENESAARELQALARKEPAFVLEHPEVYYFLARAHDALFHFDKAVRNARVYVDASATLPRVWAEGPPEPAAGSVPTTDAPGETLKL